MFMMLKKSCSQTVWGRVVPSWFLPYGRLLSLGLTCNKSFWSSSIGRSLYRFPAVADISLLGFLVQICFQITAVIVWNVEQFKRLHRCPRQPWRWEEVLHPISWYFGINRNITQFFSPINFVRWDIYSGTGAVRKKYIAQKYKVPTL